MTRKARPELAVRNASLAAVSIRYYDSTSALFDIVSWGVIPDASAVSRLADYSFPDVTRHRTASIVRGAKQAARDVRIARYGCPRQTMFAVAELLRGAE